MNILTGKQRLPIPFLILTAIFIFSADDRCLCDDFSGIRIDGWHINIGTGFRECKPVLWNFPEGEGGTGVNFTGYGYYRANVIIPSSFRFRQIAIFFQGIDDADEIFINDTEIGSTGKFPDSTDKNSGYISAWRVPRLYPIPESVIRYDEPNVILVKVYSPTGMGGIVGSEPVIDYYDILNKKMRKISLKTNIPRLIALLLILVVITVLIMSIAGKRGETGLRGTLLSIRNNFNPLLFILRCLGKTDSAEKFIQTAVTNYATAILSLACFFVFIAHELTFAADIFNFTKSCTYFFSVFVMYFGIVSLVSVIHSTVFDPNIADSEKRTNYPSLVFGTLAHPALTLCYYSPIFLIMGSNRYNDFTKRGSYITMAIIMIFFIMMIRKHAIAFLRKSDDFVRCIRFYHIISLLFLAGTGLILMSFITAPSWLYTQSMTMAGILFSIYVVSMHCANEHKIRIYNKLRIQSRSDWTARKSIKSKLNEVIVFINENYDEDISRDDIAFAIGLSPEYLSRLFNSHIKKSITEYITETRIRAATAMVESTDKTIIEIAYASGFNSLRTFNRAFLRVKGKSPTQYRLQYVNSTPVAE